MRAAIFLLTSLLVTGSVFADLRIEVTLARTTIVQNDCQLLLVEVINDSDKPCHLDDNIHPGCNGLGLELSRDMEPYEHVTSMGGGRGFCDGNTVLPERSRLEYFQLLVFPDGGYGTEPLFSKAGTYSVRASVKMAGKAIISEPRSFEVSDKSRVNWPEKSQVQTVRQVFSPPREYLNSQPPESLFREMVELSLAGEAYVKNPQVGGDEWNKKRSQTTRLMADRQTFHVAGQFYQKKEYALALQEVAHMKTAPSLVARFRKACKGK